MFDKYLGSYYDKFGNLYNWWSNSSRESFENRTKCVVDQYSSFKIPDTNLTIDGVFTLDENIADISGLKLAFLVKFL